ncbi:unnamed protein product [Closterium sp. Yama58-4]|nr:unnamed protein product [Closterium sp. Yama58-4]
MQQMRTATQLGSEKTPPHRVEARGDSPSERAGIVTSVQALEMQTQCDATLLSGNNRQRVWAVYLSIANIALRLRWRNAGRILIALLPDPDRSMTPSQKVALFQAAMAVVLEDLIKASHSRYVSIYPAARLAGMEVPSTDRYWASGANHTASEHAGMIMLAPLLVEGEMTRVQHLALLRFMEWHDTHIRATSHTDVSLAVMAEDTRLMIRGLEQNFPRNTKNAWNLLKVHLPTHLPDAIRRAGLPGQFSAAVYENAHVRTCKQPYRASNRREIDSAITQHNENQAMLSALPPDVDATRHYDTALLRAVEKETPQLTKSRRRMIAGPVRSSTGPDIFASYNSATEGGLASYAPIMRRHGFSPFPVWVHTALALPATTSNGARLQPHYARAVPSYHSNPAFSWVQYRGTNRQTRTGQLLLLLSGLTRLDGARQPVDTGVAFLRCTRSGGTHEESGCERLEMESGRAQFDVVPIAAIQWTVHVVQSFKEPRWWFLNRWADRCRMDHSVIGP